MSDETVHAVLKPTRDYSAFSLHRVNRDIVQSHVDRLEDATTDYMLLDLYPIVTTEERVIADGQNRFTMARNLLIPFYYLSSKDVLIEDVMKTNELTLSYSEDDAFATYEKYGLEPYCTLKRFIENYPEVCGRKASRPAQWISSCHKKPDFIRGNFVVDRLEWGAQLATILSDFAIYFPNREVGTAYTDAIKSIFDSPLYDHRRMMNRVEAAPARLIKCKNQQEALNVLQGIYNYNLRHDNRLDFVTITKFADRKFDMKSEPIVNSREISRRMIDQSKQSTVYVTYDHNRIKLHPLGREIRRVDPLQEFIQHRNLLPYYPIVVDDQCRILDGQRRYMAARNLGLPIYYIKSVNYSMWMATIAGAIRKDWAYEDYLQSYAAQNFPEYVWLSTVRRRYPFLGISTTLRIHRGHFQTLATEFKRGEIKFDQDYVRKLLSVWSKIGSDKIRRNFSLLVEAATLIFEYGDKFERAGRFLDLINGERGSLFEDSLPLSMMGELLVDEYNRGLHFQNRIRRPGI